MSIYGYVIKVKSFVRRENNMDKENCYRKKVDGLIGYELVHDRTKMEISIFRLNIQAQLNIETEVVPELPELWSFGYELKNSFQNK